jgi:hypothetical protein
LKILDVQEAVRSVGVIKTNGSDDDDDDDVVTRQDGGDTGG